MNEEIIEKKEISTGILLKELKKEFRYTDERICEEFEKYGKSIDRVSVNKWCNDNAVIRGKNLEILSKIFDVDAEYLKCEQPNKKKDSINDELFDCEVHHYYDSDVKLAEKVLNLFGVSVTYSEFYEQNKYLEYLLQKSEENCVKLDELKSSMLDDADTLYDLKASRIYAEYRDKLFQPVSKIIEENGKKYKITKLLNLVDVRCDYVVIKTDWKTMEDITAIKNFLGLYNVLGVNLKEEFNNVIKISFSEYMEKIVKRITIFKYHIFEYLFGI